MKARYSKISPKREAYSNYKETRQFSNKQSNLISKHLKKEEQTNPKVSRRKEIMQSRDKWKQRKQ